MRDRMSAAERPPYLGRGDSDDPKPAAEPQIAFARFNDSGYAAEIVADRVDQMESSAVEMGQAVRPANPEMIVAREESRDVPDPDAVFAREHTTGSRPDSHDGRVRVSEPCSGRVRRCHERIEL